MYCCIKETRTNEYKLCDSIYSKVKNRQTGFLADIRSSSLEGVFLWWSGLRIQRCHCRLLVWHGFSPWPGNFPMLRAWPKKKYEPWERFRVSVTTWALERPLPLVPASLLPSEGLSLSLSKCLSLQHGNCGPWLTLGTTYFQSLTWNKSLPWLPIQKMLREASN